MLVDTIQAELVRLQLHPVNLSASGKDQGLVALQGSLLKYWKTSAVLDGQWLLDILRVLPDAAGPQVVMSALCKAQVGDSPTSEATERASVLKPSDPATSDR